ncbi:MAG: ZIP family metal transporter, partial [Candidatus Omnitrophica bacterium]|nr:ZIP family metal transporter [Candidatus Omnitrophota bacterium]
MVQELWLSGFFVVGFAAIHIFIGRLYFLDIIPRSRLLSASSGVAVTYVFLHVLPLLSEAQHEINQTKFLVKFFERHVYLVALIGLIFFYGIERRVRSARQTGEMERGHPIQNPVFWLRFSAFAVYNVLIGYLLLYPMEPRYKNIWLYFLAIGLHFVSSDFGLRKDHVFQYDAYGRWILAGSVLMGWAIGLVVVIPDPVV